MLHKAEEGKLIGHAPRIKLMKEHGRHLRLDDDAEKKLLAGTLTCNWRPRTRELLRDVVMLMRDGNEEPETTFPDAVSRTQIGKTA